MIFLAAIQHFSRVFPIDTLYLYVVGDMDSIISASLPANNSINFPPYRR